MKGLDTSPLRHTTSTAVKAGPVTIQVYLDLKSPHAYLAVGPTIELARDYRCTLDWLPFELSYVDLGVTASADDMHDRVRRAPSPAGDRRARMYYATAREYARLQGLKLRGPAALLESRLANMGMLYARQQGLALPYARAVFDAGWPSGYRDFDLEDVALIESTLVRVGVDTADFAAYASGEGADEYARVQEAARASGIAGVPHYSLEHDGRRRNLFGREHLALIRGWLHDAGLQAHPAASPEFSHAWRRAAAE